MKNKAFLSLLAAATLPLSTLAQTTVDFLLTNGLAEPYGIATGDAGRFYLTDSATHRVMAYDTDNGLLSTLAGVSGQNGATNGPGFLARFLAPKGVIVARGGLVVADSGNHTLRFLTLTGGISIVSTLAGSPGQPALVDGPTAAARFNTPAGLAVDTAGNIYVADSKNNAIRKIDLLNNVTTVATGFSEPAGLALDDNNQILVADSKNHAIKIIRANGTVELLAGSANKISGTNDSFFATESLFNLPSGVFWLGGNLGVMVADTGNHTLRRVFFNPVIAQFFPQLNGYSVETYAGAPRQAGFVDGLMAGARFNAPTSVAKDSDGGLLVTDLGNRAVRRIQTTPRLPRVKNPTIGYVTFIVDPQTGAIISRLNSFTNAAFNNDAIIAVSSEVNTESFYTVGPTPAVFEQDTIPVPNSQNSLAAPFYQDGSAPDQVKPTILSPTPDVTIKIVGTGEGRRPSELVQARAQFKAATPTVIGDNPASFIVSCETTNAVIWYTLDGTIPTNEPPSLEVRTATLTIVTNSPFTFKARAFRDRFKPSEVATKVFSPTEFRANRISFGFERGEASSDFVASPGQRFYAPVTMILLPNTVMYSLQFNLIVTNLGAAPAVAAGAVGFASTLTEEYPVGSKRYRTIPPAQFVAAQVDPPAMNSIYTRSDGVPLVNLMVINSALNLIGVGWLERAGETNLFNTISQDLITFSQPHDTIFLGKSGKVVAGAFSFTVPPVSAVGDTYKIVIGRASATSDGVGRPGSDVFIDMPVNGSLSAGSLNAIKHVVVGQRSYIVGDAAPFRWFNAGDFGNTNLFSDDVVQVFQTAIYNANPPIPGTDFFDSMDSCCTPFAAVPNAAHVLPAAPALSGPQQNVLLDGNDTTINNLAFGDGLLNVADIYTTFRRSLDPTLTWYSRFWTNGVLGAQAAANLFRGQPSLPAESFSNAADEKIESNEPPSISFAAPDLFIKAGETIEIPIRAEVHGKYPARICMLSVDVQPLEGAPELSEPVRFSPNPDLGAPTLDASRTLASYGAAWLNRSVRGLRGATQIGMLKVKLPAELPPNAAYRVRFEHASASPNGLAVLKQEVQDGLLLAAPRIGSKFNDGIPDTWRLRYFGSADNLLSHANADADGDGVRNADEFKAGTNPSDLRSHLRMHADAVKAGQAPPNIVLRWPSAKGKKYAIEAASSLVGRDWTPVAANVVGTGGDMQFTAPNAEAGWQFYRVRVVE